MHVQPKFARSNRSPGCSCSNRSWSFLAFSNWVMTLWSKDFRPLQQELSIARIESGQFLARSSLTGDDYVIRGR